MINQDFTVLISAALPTTLFLVGYWAWSRQRRRTGLAKEGTSAKRAAHMPVDFLKPEQQKLSGLAPGATTSIDFSDIAVDLSGKTYVNLDSMVHEEPHSNTVTVREMSGGYILFIPKGREEPMLFTPGRLLTSIVRYAPVIQIVEDESDRVRLC